MEGKGNIRVERGDKVFNISKIKPVNHMVKGVATVEVIDKDGRIVEKITSDNIVKTNNILKDSVVAEEFFRGFALNKTNVLRHATGSFLDSSRLTRIYLLDSKDLEDIEQEGLDLRLSDANIETKAYAKFGTAESPTDTRGVWVSTDVTYPARNVRRTTSIFDFPLATGNSGDGNIDAILLTAGNEIERTAYNGTKDIASALWMEGAFGMTHSDSSTSEFYSNNVFEAISVEGNNFGKSWVCKYDGEWYFFGGDDSLITIKVRDKASNELTLFQTDIPTSCSHVGMDLDYEGNIYIAYNDGGFKIKKYSQDGTLLGTKSFAVSVHSYLKGMFVEDDGNVFLVFATTDTGSKLYCSEVNFNTEVTTTEFETEDTINYATNYSPYWGMARLKKGSKSFVICHNDYSTHNYSRSYMFIVNYETGENERVCETGGGSNITNVFHTTEICNSYLAYTNQLGLAIKTDKSNDLSYGIHCAGNNVRLCEFFGLGMSNKQFAINKITPITKNDERSLRITYTIDEDFNGLSIFDGTNKTHDNNVLY